MNVSYMNVPKVISLVVDQDMCVGCGLCISHCSSKSIKMDWSDKGFMIPIQEKECQDDSSCLDVCPFNPFPNEEVKTEDELGELFLRQAKNIEPNIGRYHNIYVGYSKKYRDTSSSGGLATYILKNLFERKIADYAFVVSESGGFYQYNIINGSEELKTTSKTRYYPVTLSNVFEHLNTIKGTIAIVGVACFIKAVRLAQYKSSHLKIKIPFLIGIICGGLKSRFFTEYLASKTGLNIPEFKKPEYRIKDVISTASDYSFGCTSIKNNSFKTIKMKEVGDMWGTGLFKNNACDFCEDVTTELSDISLGDAWMDPYNLDGNGTNIVITRSNLAEEIIMDGMASMNLVLENLSLKGLLQSQQGSFNHRHHGLRFRIKEREKSKQLVPPKRPRNMVNISFEFQIVQRARRKTREESLKIWPATLRAEAFDSLIRKYLISLKIKTRLYHYLRLLKKKYFHEISVINNWLT